jgi:dethiobiotin synthetase
MTAQGLRNSDALALQRNSRVRSIMPGKPYTFAEPTSPHIVSAEKDGRLRARMSAGLRTLETQADWVLVEGAGAGLRRFQRPDLCRLGGGRAAAGDSGGGR